MDDREKLEIFGELVDASQKMAKSANENNEKHVAKLYRICMALIAALVAISLIFGGLVFYLVNRAYADTQEVKTEQSQDFDGRTQTYTSSITDGK